MKLKLLATVVGFIIAMTPVSAYAASNCDGLLCWFWDMDMGVTERAEIKARKEEGIALVNADRDKALKQAQVQIEQAQAAGRIGEAQAKALSEQYKAQIDAWADVQIKMISENGESQRQTLIEQSQIAQAGIKESGSTQRLLMMLESLKEVLVIVLVFVAGWILTRPYRNQRHWIGTVPGQRLTEPYNYKQIDLEEEEEGEFRYVERNELAPHSRQR